MLKNKQTCREKITERRVNLVVQLCKDTQKYANEHFHADQLEVNYKTFPNVSTVKVWLESDLESESAVMVSASGFLKRQNLLVPMIRVDSNTNSFFIGKHPRILLGFLMAEPIDAEHVSNPIVHAHQKA